LQDFGLLNCTIDGSKFGRSASENIKFPDLEWYRVKYFKRYQTKNLYEQEKFNLLREENEGYAKLVVQINQPNFIDKTSEDLKVLRSNIQQLIGYFNLDPNRVLDLQLEALENNISQVFYLSNSKSRVEKMWQNLDKFEKLTSTFLELINVSKSTSISSLLGFKL
jgi:hypothetical protein